jgi:tetratricopeptide (TPR) repeat protein
VLAKLGDRAQAIAHHERAAAIDPEFADPHYQIGLIMVREGKVSEAKARFEQVLRINPDHINAKQDLARTAASQN